MPIGQPETKEHQFWRRFYEERIEVRKARFEVLRKVMPRTVELVEKAEALDDEIEKGEVLRESVNAFFIENGQFFSEEIFTAWQQSNPLPKRCWAWIQKRIAGNKFKRSIIDPVDYELTANWNEPRKGQTKSYRDMTAQELAETLHQITGIELNEEQVKKRRQRLGLTTARPFGPRPRSEQEFGTTQT
jgi:hypothetical protein